MTIAFGEEDVVVGPVGVVAEGELRVIGADLVDLVAADEADLGHAGSREGAERPVEQAPTVNLGVAFRGVGGGGHEAPAAAGADDDGFHAGKLRVEG